MRLRHLIFCILLLAVSCAEKEPIYKDVIKEVPVTPLSKYVYDGKDYSVHTLLCSEDENYVELMIAREPEAPYTSYVALFVHKDNVGKTLDFSNPSLTNRLDYMIIFEDVDHYYSPMFAPLSGTLKVQANPYRAVLDAVMADGKRLTLDCTGFVEATEE